MLRNIAVKRLPVPEIFQLTGLSVMALLWLLPCSVYSAQSLQPTGPYCLIEQELATPGADFVVASLKRMYHGRISTEEGLNDLFCLNDTQYQAAERRLTDGSGQVALSKRLHDRSLQLMAARDLDSDGVLDFRIKEFGTFAENDPDADNDGIPNLLDPRPLSADSERDGLSNNDADRDGLPDHLDWSEWNRLSPEAERKSESLVRLQKKIYRKYNFILLEEEGSIFSETFADMVYDVLRVFSKMLRLVPQQDVPRSITVASRYDVDPQDVLAEVSPATDRMVIYTEVVGDIDDDPRDLFSPFLVLVHEFAHVIQNAMDYPDNKPGLWHYNTHVAPKNFARRLSDLGWKLESGISVGIEPVASFIDHGNEPISMKAQYKEANMTALRDMCTNLWENYDEKLWKKHHLVTCYSLVSVREWHAEYLATAVLIRMYDRLNKKHLSISSDIICRAQKKLEEDSGSDIYDYTNADPKRIKALQKDLGLRSWRVDPLVNKYLVNPFTSNHALEESCVDMSG